MAKIFALFFLFMSSLTYSQEFSVSFIAQQSIDESNDKDSLYFKLFQKFENFIHYEDTSLLTGGKNTIDDLYGVLTIYRSYEPEDMDFQLLRVDDFKQDTVSLLIKSELNFTKKPEFLYLYEARFIKNGAKWSLDNQLRFNEFVRTDNNKGICFYSTPDISIAKIESEATNFIETFSQKFKLKPKHNLNYLVAAPKDIMRVNGFNYYLSPPNQFSKKENLLKTSITTASHNHELIHYCFSNYKMKKFLSEGIAVYYGGTNNKKYSIENVKHGIRLNDETALDTNMLNKRYELFIDGEVGYGNDHLFYSIGAYLIDCYLKEHTEKELLNVVRLYPDITPKKFADQYLGVNFYNKNTLLSFVKNKGVLD